MSLRRLRRRIALKYPWPIPPPKPKEPEEEKEMAKEPFIPKPVHVTKVTRGRHFAKEAKGTFTRISFKDQPHEEEYAYCINLTSYSTEKDVNKAISTRATSLAKYFSEVVKQLEWLAENPQIGVPPQPEPEQPEEEKEEENEDS